MLANWGFILMAFAGFGVAYILLHRRALRRLSA